MTAVIIIVFIISWRMTLFMIAIMIPGMFYAKTIGPWFKKIAKDISD